MTDPADAAVPFDVDWNLHIPMRDGVTLNACAYRPRGVEQVPCIVSLSPYGTQRAHDRAVYFAGHGYTFVAVDSRGRGGSQGRFRPFIQEGPDGHDLVEWVAVQPWCNGSVGMHGGSYVGHVQWATSRERPQHLTSLAPTASVYPGLDFPMRKNVGFPYAARWLNFVSARAAQERVFADLGYWTRVYRESYEGGRPFCSLARYAGENSGIFDEWVRHPLYDEYWRSHVPSPADYAAISAPILTVTGCYDDDQLGALSYYRNHMLHGEASVKARHYLVIGPWDHAGTQTPQAAFGGITVGSPSLLDMNQLHLAWYDWTLSGGARPAFLEDRVSYYVMAAERWKYAPTLESVTVRHAGYHLDSHGTAGDVFGAGALRIQRPSGAAFDRYVHDPADATRAAHEVADHGGLTDQRHIMLGAGRQLIYHSEPFDRAAEISGCFRLIAWIAIDQPDTDFKADVYEITKDGASVLLGSDCLRARHREGLDASRAIATGGPLRYEFDGFNFISREVQASSRLRLVLAAPDSISLQKNYNSGDVIAMDTTGKARVVTVKLFHDRTHPSVLLVPFGHSEHEWKPGNPRAGD